jgi:enoyl-CoA hydratase/carnithine racemase
LRRPGGNRFSFELLSQWNALMQRLAPHADVRAVLLTAEGPDFSFGADLSDPEMANRVAGSREDRMSIAALGQQALDGWANLPVPTIAAARGRIIGAGACFFGTADFQFAAPEARLQFPEVDRGMHLSWGVIPRLVARYGFSYATQLALTGQPVACTQLPQPPLRIDQTPEAEAQRLAESFAAKPPMAVRAIKRVLADCSQKIQEAAAEDAALFADTIGSADFAEAMSAWFEKRPGKFLGR